MDIARLLIEHGANINAKLYDGTTALMLAVNRGDLDLVRFLVQKGADINAKAKDGTTALWNSLIGSHGPILRYLLENGAEVVVRNKKNGATILMVASEIGNREVVDILIEKGATD